MFVLNVHLFINTKVFAQSPEYMKMLGIETPKKEGLITLDDNHFSEQILVKLFFNAAFSDVVWQENRKYFTELYNIYRNRVEDSDKPAQLINRKNIKQSFNAELERNKEYYLPYYREVISNNPPGIARHNAINKWSKEDLNINIFYKPGSNKEPLLENYIQDLSKDISTHLGKNFVISYDQKEALDINIILGDSKLTKENYKDEIGALSPRRTEAILIGAVEFSPEKINGVAGFILPNVNNEIITTYCYITEQETNVGQIQIKECLLRSLGLVDDLDTYGMSDPNITTILDNDSNASQNPDLSELDLKLLSILYCPAVESGMDKNATLVALAGNPNCFNDK